MAVFVYEFVSILIFASFSTLSTVLFGLFTMNKFEPKLL